MPGSGLRERKKVRTRAMLIEAAAELCLRQGFDSTTVDQIAAAADVSPRTFSRYFPTKESVVAAINDDMDEFVAKALEAQPLDVSEYEALLGAHLAIFRSVDGYESPAFKRMAVLIQIVNGSASFKSSAFAQRHDISENAAIATIASRMGVRRDHPAVLLVADTWTLLFATSFAGLGRVDGDRLDPQVLCDRLSETFELFRRSWSPWTAVGQPHTSAASG